jgi:hypothetical protein
LMIEIILWCLVDFLKVALDGDDRCPEHMWEPETAVDGSILSEHLNGLTWPCNLQKHSDLNLTRA